LTREGEITASAAKAGMIEMTGARMKQRAIGASG